MPRDLLAEFGQTPTAGSRQPRDLLAGRDKRGSLYRQDRPSSQQTAVSGVGIEKPTVPEGPVFTQGEQPGFFEQRVVPLLREYMGSVPDRRRARSAIAMGIAEAKGYDPVAVEENLDQVLVQEYGQVPPDVLRERVLTSAVAAGLGAGAVTAPFVTAAGATGYMGTKAVAERGVLPLVKMGQQLINDEELKWEVTQLQDLFPEELGNAAQLAEFVLYGQGAKMAGNWARSPQGQGFMNGLRYRAAKVLGIKIPTEVGPLGAGAEQVELAMKQGATRAALNARFPAEGKVHPRLDPQLTFRDQQNLSGLKPTNVPEMPVDLKPMTQPGPSRIGAHPRPLQITDYTVLPTAADKAGFHPRPKTPPIEAPTMVEQAAQIMKKEAAGEPLTAAERAFVTLANQEYEYPLRGEMPKPWQPSSEPGDKPLRTASQIAQEIDDARLELERLEQQANQAEKDKTLQRSLEKAWDDFKRKQSFQRKAEQYTTLAPTIEGTQEKEVIGRVPEDVPEGATNLQGYTPRDLLADTPQEQGTTRLYHGSPEGKIESLIPDENGLIFLADDPGYAKQYADHTERAASFAGYQPEVSEFDVDLGKVADFTNPIDLPEKTMDIIEGQIGMEPLLGKGTMQDLEDPVIIEALKEAGFNSIKAFNSQRGIRETEYAIFDTTQATSPVDTPESPQETTRLRGGIPLPTAEEIKALPSRVGAVVDTLREATGMPDIKSKTYQNTFEATENWRKESNLSIFDAQIINRDVKRAIPARASRVKVTHALDTGNPGELDSTEKAVFTYLKDMYDGYRTRLQEEGILDSFLDDYINHIILSTPKKPVHQTKTGGKLGTKPGFTKQRGRKDDDTPWTIKELQELGYEVQDDPAVLAAYYKHMAERSIANKHLVDYLKTGTTDEGLPLLATAKELPQDQKENYMAINDAALRKWEGKKVPGGKVYFQQETLVHKDAHDIVNNAIVPNEPPTFLKKMYYTSRTGVKRVIMYNPLFHGLNIGSNVFMGTDTVNYLRDNLKHVSVPKTEQEVDALQREMVQNGIELQGLFDVGKRLGEDVHTMKIPEDKSIKDMIKNPIKALANLNDSILWDKIVKTGQSVVYLSQKNSLMERGLSEEKAGLAAANITNDLMGTLPRTWFTKGQRKWLGRLLFARNWNVSNFRTVTGALGRGAKSGAIPKPARLEGLNDAQLKALGKSYRKVILKGIIGAAVTANIVQAIALKSQGKPYHPTWMNETGHKMDINLGMQDEEGKTLYLRNWMFRQIDDYVKFATGHPLDVIKSKMEPILRSGIEVLFNIGWDEQPIRRKGTTAGRQAVDVMKYLVKGLTPIDSFMENVPIVDEEMNKKRLTWIDKLAPLTGTWVRRGMPTGQDNPEYGNVLKEFYEFRSKEKTLRKDAKRKYSKTYQNGDIDAARSMIDNIVITPEIAKNIEKSLTRPFIYRVTTKSGKLKPDFIRYIMHQDEARQKKILDLLEKLKKN